MGSNSGEEMNGGKEYMWNRRVGGGMVEKRKENMVEWAKKWRGEMGRREGRHDGMGEKRKGRVEVGMGGGKGRCSGVERKSGEEIEGKEKEK